MPSQFLKPAVIILSAMLPVWLVARTIADKKAGQHRRPKTFRETILSAMFFVYCAVVVALTLYPLGTFNTPRPNSVNLVPIIKTARNSYEVLTTQTKAMIYHNLDNILGNLAMFLPLGTLLPILFRRFRSFKKVVAVAFLSSALIESLQYISSFAGIYRSADIDDVILNTLGAALGYFIYYILFSKQLRREEIGLLK